MRSPFSTLGFILAHPLNRRHRIAADRRYLLWQIGSRILPGPVAISFVNDSRLLISRGMTGATGNLYCGLHEFEDMAFVLHSLVPGDRFVDVGANIGSYTILAAVTGCKDCVGVEPAPATFEAYGRNEDLNGCESVVRAERLGVGAAQSSLRFTSGLDSVNHILAPGGDTPNSVEVEVRTLDGIVGTLNGPTIIKIDVEGYETEVLAAA